jgi:hypothetical protein
MNRGVLAVDMRSLVMVSLSWACNLLVKKAEQR